MALKELDWSSVAQYGDSERPPQPTVWDYIKPAPHYPASILVNGSVVDEVLTPDLDSTLNADTYIRGGERFRVEDTDPLYALLVGAGYTFRDVA